VTAEPRKAILIATVELGFFIGIKKICGRVKMKNLILIVDDHPDLVELLQKALEFFGYEVLVAKNGSEAVEIAHSKLPDLIVMDIFMPLMNGIKATSLIRLNPKTKHIPILAATANAAEGDRERCLAAGCDDYIPKPFTYQKLIAVINELLKCRGKQSMSEEIH
jgi:two-component system cell cycle response regulator DivK